MRLAAFAGGCTIEAAQDVCGDDLEVVDGLASLTDKGLARLEGTDEEPRFTMLETIREYAGERLEESAAGRRAARRHAEWFLALAEETEPNLSESGAMRSGSTGWNGTTTTSAPPWTGSRLRAKATVPCGWQPRCGDSGI